MGVIGKLLGDRYRVERLLGTGRFASVYASMDTAKETTVALKVFKVSIEQRTVVGRRFFKRAKSAMVSPHRLVVPITDAGLTPEGTPFLVMEYLEGRTVDLELQARGALPISRSLHIAATMLQGLSAIHAEGSVHRDINPANLFLVDPEFDKPIVRILDLGVAQDLVDHLAVSPSSIGTTRFLAPEILLDPGGAWTPSLDVFAAGMVLFVMLTGRLPFDRAAYVGSDQNTIDAYKSIYSLPGPSKFAPQVPAVIDEVVKKAIAITPSERYLNAQEMVEALESARALANIFEFKPAPDVESKRLQTREQWHAVSDVGVMRNIPEGISPAFDEPSDEDAPEIPVQERQVKPVKAPAKIANAVHAYMDLFSPDFPPLPQLDGAVHYEPTKKLVLPEGEDDPAIEIDSQQTEIDWIEGTRTMTLSEEMAKDVPHTLDLAIMAESDVDSTDKTIDRRIQSNPREEPDRGGGVETPYMVLERLYAVGANVDTTLVDSGMEDDFAAARTHPGSSPTVVDLNVADITETTPIPRRMERPVQEKRPAELHDEEPTKAMSLPPVSPTPQQAPQPSDKALHDLDKTRPLSILDIEAYFPDLQRRKVVTRLLIASGLVLLVTALLFIALSAASNCS